MSGQPSFFNNVGQVYGVEAHDTLKQIARLHDKITKLNNRKKFLRQCRTNNVIPQHIQLHVHCLQDIQQHQPRFSSYADKIIRKFKKAILSLEIKMTYHVLHEKEHILKDKLDSLRRLLPVEVLQAFLTMEHNKQKILDARIRSVNLKKLKRLKERVWFGTQHDNRTDKTSMLVNLTDTSLPEKISEILSLGPKFAINPPRNHKSTFTNLLADTECTIAHVHRDDEQLKNQKRQMANNIITNFINRPVKVDPVSAYFCTGYNETKRWLTQNKDICVTTSDKGNKTVIMNKDDYKDKMNAILSDTNTYEPIQRDPTNKIKNNHNKLIKEVTSQGGLEKQVSSTLICQNGTLGRIYGKVKLHKQEKPVRPIISTIGTTYYKTSKYMSNIIRKILGNTTYDAIDSFKLALELRQLEIPEGYILVSFDVVSMFTNIPTNLVVEIINERWAEIRTLTTLNKTQFCEILKSIFENCYFTYNNNFYKQKKGLPMGSPLSPALADLVLEKVLKTTMEIVGEGVLFLRRYVDDLLLIVEENQVEMVLEQFNNFHPNIQFTMETELLDAINFLELNIRRNDVGSLDVTWYRKPTASLRYINFYSSHSFGQKINIIHMLAKRLRLFCGLETLIEQRKEVVEILLKNDYPRTIINHYLNKFMSEEMVTAEPVTDGVTGLEQDDQTNDDHETHVRYYKIPSVKGVSTQLRRALETENTKIVFYHTFTVGGLYSNMKDRIPIEKQSNVVYQLTCDCGAHYIGQTSQMLSKRIQQHQASLRRLTSGKLQIGENSGVTQHMTEKPNHNILFDEVKIIEKESNYHKRLFKEAIHIGNTQLTMNLKRDVADHVVTSLYSNVIAKTC